MKKIALLIGLVSGSAFAQSEANWNQTMVCDNGAATVDRSAHTFPESYQVIVNDTNIVDYLVVEGFAERFYGEDRIIFSGQWNPALGTVGFEPQFSIDTPKTTVKIIQRRDDSSKGKVRINVLGDNGESIGGWKFENCDFVN